MQPAPSAETPAPAESQAKPRRKLLLWLTLGIVLIGIVLIVGLMIYSGSEPEYQGVALSKWLERYNDNVDAEPQRTNAVEAVRHIGPKAIPFLLRWASATDSPLRQKVEDWMDNHFPALGVSLTDADDLHDRAFTGFLLLGPQGKSAIPVLQNLLANTNSAETAARALCLFTPESTPILVGALANTNTIVRVAIASAISEWNQGAELPSSPQAGRQIILPMPLVTNLLQDSESGVRVVAIHSLGAAATNKAVQPEAAVLLLIQQLKDPDFECRFEATDALTNFGPDAAAAIPALLDILKNGSGLGPMPGAFTPRGKFAVTLVPASGPGSSNQFVQAVSPSIIIRHGNQNWVPAPVASAGGVPPALSLNESDGGYVVNALRALHADPSHVIPILEDQLQSSNAATCYWAIEGLESYAAQAKSSVPRLLQLGAGQDPIPRMTIFHALAKIDPENARSHLKLLDVDYQDSKLVLFEEANLVDTDPIVRQIGAYRLGNFGTAAKITVPKLVTLLNDKDETVRAAAAEALKKIDPDAAAKAGVK